MCFETTLELKFISVCFEMTLELNSCNGGHRNAVHAWVDQNQQPVVRIYGILAHVPFFWISITRQIPRLDEWYLRSSLIERKHTLQND